MNPRERIQALIAHGKLAEAEIECYAALSDDGERQTLLDEIRDKSFDRMDLRVPTDYHRWYYDHLVWQNIRWLGVTTLKSPTDLWNYQEIIWELRPSAIVEFGTNEGGSALFFRSILDMAKIEAAVITVDRVDVVHPIARARPGIRWVAGSTTSQEIHDEVARAVERSRPGKVFAILDSDHHADHVYNEMVSLRDILRAGDYLVVEDGSVNGNPVLPDYGPGPYEAIQRYHKDFPGDYRRDRVREEKFGFTFAPAGYLLRNS